MERSGIRGGVSFLMVCGYLEISFLVHSRRKQKISFFKIVFALSMWDGVWICV
jgi:hypothetical protein